MKLFHSPTSPYVRKVMIILHETGRTGEVELIPTATTPLATDGDLAARNPLGKVPCLIDAEDRAIFDSRVISAYFGEPAGLYPTDRVWRLRSFEAMCDGVLDAAILCVYESRLREEGTRSGAWVEGQMAKISRALAAATREADLLEGDLTIAQVAAGAMLGYLDLRFPEAGWREAHPVLATWYEGFSARPSMRETAPPS